ncbi:unnamed protein product [Paramecium sonneborni]|uniref:Protein kinase domain-containing protein n=1 Tax=Paramecium sonneborni TaxID=65129 RepID=A0A8S1RHD1_9CILI|nr:unnamed protein product [Paramecium sonneborni]
MQTKAEYEEFEIQQCFGCPEYKVKVAKNQEGQQFLLNFFDISQRDQLQKLQNIRNLEHPSILKIIQIREEGNYKKKNGSQLLRSCVIYEYPQGGELYEYIFQTGKFNETQARIYFKQIVEGLIEVHKLGQFHGELTIDNIFFSDAKQIKIGELGQSQIRKKKYIYEGSKWTEINNNHQQSKDIFALGMILYSLMFGKPPFSFVENNTFFNALQTSPHKFWEKVQNNFQDVIITNHFKDLIQGMLTETPNNRMSLSEVYKHPWTQINSEITEEMIKEFNSKQNMIQQFLIKNRLNREIRKSQMLMNNDKQQLQRGIGNFYRSNERDTSIIQDNQIEGKQIKQIAINLLKPDNYVFSSINPEEIMNSIRQNLEVKPFNLQLINGFQQNNQFKIMIQSELRVEIKVQILQLETEEDILCFHFTRLKGEFQNYLETVKQFHKLIDENLKKFPQLNEQII